MKGTRPVDPLHRIRTGRAPVGSPPMARRRLGGNFARLWTAGAVSNLGDGVVLAAMPLLAASLSDSPTVVALVATAGTLPWLLFSLVGGAILLIGRFVPLGLTLLGPVIVNILLFHIFLEPKGLAVAVVFAVLTLIVLCANREAFKGLLKP